MRVLITGGAGFVGAHIARALVAHHPDIQVHVLDNLKRRGSETNLGPFQSIGIHFFHGDVRSAEDFSSLPGDYDVLIDCSAEPSVHAGAKGGPRNVIEINLGGTLNCLEYARKACRGLIFLSTSRVYSVEPLRALPLIAMPTHFALVGDSYSSGIAEDFPTNSFRTFYGTSKLASEQLIQEYAAFYDLPCVINRCSNIAGPGQFGKVDQGVVVYWLLSHIQAKPLRYMGFGGAGLQVRDLLHPMDLFDLLSRQLRTLSTLRAEVFNVGGGKSNAVSLMELTELCIQTTGNVTQIDSIAETSRVDVPYFVANTQKAQRAFGWTPALSVQDIITETYQWLINNRETTTRIRGFV